MISEKMLKKAPFKIIMDFPITFLKNGKLISKSKIINPYLENL
jgi:hypothetical protein